VRGVDGWMDFVLVGLDWTGLEYGSAAFRGEKQGWSGGLSYPTGLRPCTTIFHPSIHSSIRRRARTLHLSRGSFPPAPLKKSPAGRDV
jgi:hypothetical protein